MELLQLFNCLLQLCAAVVRPREHSVQDF